MYGGGDGVHESCDSVYKCVDSPPNVAYPNTASHTTCTMGRRRTLLIHHVGPNVSIAREVGPAYSAAGTDVSTMSLRANAFCRMVREDPIARVLVPDADDYVVPDKPECPLAELSGTWTALYDDLFLIGDNNPCRAKIRAARILAKHFQWRAMHRDLAGFLTVDEGAVRQALAAHFAGKNLARATVDSTVSSLRQFFFAVGRKHEYADAQNLMGLDQTVLVNTGNPVTSNVAEAARIAAQADGKKRRRGATAGPEDDEEDRKGFPASIALSYHAFLKLFQAGVSAARHGDGTDVRRAVNAWLTALLLLFCMHDVVRPVEIYAYLHHRHLYTYETLDDSPAGRKRYLLALAFVRPETLSILVRRDILPHRYVMTTWKGKFAEKYVDRIKTTMAPDTNGLDLAVWYAVIMRLVLIVRQLGKPEHFDVATKPLMHAENVFYKGDGDLERARKDAIARGDIVTNDDRDATLPIRERSDSQWLHHLNTYFCAKVGIAGFTLYSLRYAHAEEMKKTGIRSGVRRMLMGHTEVSDMNLTYANNRMKRPTATAS